MKLFNLKPRLNLGAQWFRSKLPRHQPGVFFVVPHANWATDWVGQYVTQNVQRQFGLRAQLISNPRWLAGQIIHYGSLWEAVGSLGSKQNLRNAIVATIFHGDRQGDNATLAEALDQIIENQEQFEKIVVANRIMEQRFHDWGVPAEKIERIPLGVDLTLFKPSSVQARADLRNRLGIPDDAFCVGSFQKDGVGWEEGLQPKLIKGPDIFVEVLAKLAKRHKLHVLLTAPARGYVKRGLEKAGIAYTHRVFENYPDLAPLYGALDTYLVTSREEGGPKGVLEALASGVPLVSTQVGMTQDVIEDGINGLVADIDDVKRLEQHLLRLVGESNFSRKMVQAGIKTAQSYDWEIIANDYFKLIYRPLKEKLTAKKYGLINRARTFSSLQSFRTLRKFDTDYAPIFICGVSGSGTSVLVSLLDQNFENAATIHESARWAPEDASIFVKQLQEYKKIGDYVNEIQEVSGISSEKVRFDSLNLYRRFTRFPKTANVVFDKAPNTHLLRAAKLYEAFPQAKFLLIFRDPIASVEGLRRKWPLFEKHNLQEVCEFWEFVHKKFIDTAIEQGLIVFPISYERIVESPESTLKIIEQFFGLTRRTNRLAYEDIENVPGKGLRNVVKGKISVVKNANELSYSQFSEDEKDQVYRKLMPLYKRMSEPKFLNNQDYFSPPPL